MLHYFNHKARLIPERYTAPLFPYFPYHVSAQNANILITRCAATDVESLNTSHWPLNNQERKQKFANKHNSETHLQPAS